MCKLNQNIIDASERIINQLTDQRQLFTAFDVTCLLRNEGIPDLPKHYELKEIVHDMFKQNRMNRDYIRQQYQVAGPYQPSAFVYLPHDADISSYKADAFNQAASQISSAPVSVPNPVPAPAPDHGSSTAITNRNTDLKQNKVIADSRGRVHVPSKFLASIGLGAYDTAFVQNLGGVIHIFKRAQPNASNLKSQQVDCYRNLKVTVGHDKAGASYRFVINSASGQITIS